MLKLCATVKVMSPSLSCSSVDLVLILCVTVTGAGSGGEVSLPDTVSDDQSVRGQVPHRRHQGPHLRPGKYSTLPPTRVRLGLPSCWQIPY